MQAGLSILDRFQRRQLKWYGHSLECKVVVGQKRFTSGHRTVGGEEEDSIKEEEPSDIHEKQKHGRRYDTG